MGGNPLKDGRAALPQLVMNVIFASSSRVFIDNIFDVTNVECKEARCRSLKEGNSASLQNAATLAKITIQAMYA